MIRAVLFDLDDTLFPQQRWLDGAWQAVARSAANDQIDERAILRALHTISREGSDRGRIIDRALEQLGIAEFDATPLIKAFQQHRSDVLHPYPGVRDALSELGRTVAMGLVTDGHPSVQRGKLSSLNLADVFDVVVVSDELGRQYRKPHPKPFLAALDALGVSADDAVFIGDRPDKDVAGAQALGIRTVRVLTGEYCRMPNDPPAWAMAADVCSALAVLRPSLPSLTRKRARTSGSHVPR